VVESELGLGEVEVGLEVEAVARSVFEALEAVFQYTLPSLESDASECAIGEDERVARELCNGGRVSLFFGYIVAGFE